MSGGFFDRIRRTAAPSDGAAGRFTEKKKPPVKTHEPRKNKSAHQKGHEEGGGGGGHDNEDTLWLYSFNDMLFNLLLFFIVMYSISTIDEKKFEQVKQALSGDNKPRLVNDDDQQQGGVTLGPRNGMMDAKSLGASGGEAGGDKSAAIAAAIRFMLERAEQSDVKLARGTGKSEEKKEDQKKKSKYIAGTNIPLPLTLVFPHTEFFLQGTADLSPDGRQNLSQLAREIASVEKFGRADIEVHTPFSEQMMQNEKGVSDFSSLKLSTQRAGVIFGIFIQEGIPHKKVISAGYADGRPLVLSEKLTKKQRQEFSDANDRIVISLSREGIK